MSEVFIACAVISNSLNLKVINTFRFPDEWDATSNHRVRTSTDMQFSFAYFYYLMGVKKNSTMEDVFDRMDTDNSRFAASYFKLLGNSYLSHI